MAFLAAGADGREGRAGQEIAHSEGGWRSDLQHAHEDTPEEDEPEEDEPEEDERHNDLTETFTLVPRVIGGSYAKARSHRCGDLPHATGVCTRGRPRPPALVHARRHRRRRRGAAAVLAPIQRQHRLGRDRDRISLMRLAELGQGVEHEQRGIANRVRKMRGRANRALKKWGRVTRASFPRCTGPGPAGHEELSSYTKRGVPNTDIDRFPSLDFPLNFA